MVDNSVIVTLLVFAVVLTSVWIVAAAVAQAIFK
jgi:hypothetical protein